MLCNLGLLTAIGLIAGSIPPLAAAGRPARPNLVFILADDLGWRDVGFNGSPFYETPHIDALAKRGMVFTQAYAANPLCSPTRSSILTGLYPARTGITAPMCHLPQVVLEKGLVARADPAQKLLVANSVTRLKTDYVTLPKVLKQAGDATAHFGKWHLGAEPYSPLEHGFDSDVPHWPGPGPAGAYVAPWKSQQFKLPAKPGEHVEDLMAAAAVKFIQSHRDRPFFLNYWAFSVHSPFDAKPALIEKYRAKAKTLPKNSPQRNPLYAAMVQSLDENVGRLVRAIDDAGLADRTVIVFFSDNGGVHWTGHTGTGNDEELRQVPITSNFPLRGGKATTYEGGMREPCIVVWPGVTKAGTTSAAVIQSTDFFPAFAELLPLPLPAGHVFDGKSFAPALRGQAHDRGPTFCHFPHSTPASGGLASTWVRVGDWKLLRFYGDNPDRTDRLELYNLREDLSETKNLAAEHPERVKELAALIEKFLADTRAVVPRANPAYDPTAKPPAAKPKPARPKAK